MPIKTPRLSSREASQYLRDEWGVQISAGHLKNLAQTGEGPLFEKDGRFRTYQPKNLDVYAEDRLSPLVRSTSELAVLRKSRAA